MLGTVGIPTPCTAIALSASRKSVVRRRPRRSGRLRNAGRIYHTEGALFSPQVVSPHLLNHKRVDHGDVPLDVEKLR